MNPLPFAHLHPQGCSGFPLCQASSGQGRAIPGKGDQRFPMRHQYELTFIVRLDPSEEVMNSAISQVQGWVEANDLGKVNKADRWGKRKLAYEIDKQRDGYYVCMDADIDPQNLPELERNLRLSPSILRYLLIRPDR